MVSKLVEHNLLHMEDKKPWMHYHLRTLNHFLISTHRVTREKEVGQLSAYQLLFGAM